ncbi:MAG: hypothetical protein EB023_01270 [Flavobacteriia bacterium]|nr:hypothetical protein [Flavobacteriia bacterium]
MLYVNNNGKVLPRESAQIVAGSRAFLYGDGVFESIRILHGKPIHLTAHWLRMKRGAEALCIEIPDFFDETFLLKHIQELCELSKIFTGGRCRVSLDRMEGGLYKPEKNTGVFFIEVMPLEENEFQLNYKGLEVDIYKQVKLQKTFLSPFKTKNGIVKVMAAIHASQQGLDDFILQSDKGNIIETSNSNLFIVSNGVLYTPGLDEGCIAGTMRMMVINIAIQNNIRVYECPILPHNLLSADEVFTTNAILGIRWVGGYRTKRYLNTISRRLVMLLNAYWTKESE